MKLTNEISEKELSHLIESGSVLAALAAADGWDRKGDVLYHATEGVIVEVHAQAEPAAYSDMDDMGAAILREAGFAA